MACGKIFSLGEKGVRQGQLLQWRQWISAPLEEPDDPLTLSDSS